MEGVQFASVAASGAAAGLVRIAARLECGGRLHCCDLVVPRELDAHVTVGLVEEELQLPARPDARALGGDAVDRERDLEPRLDRLPVEHHLSQ